MDRAIPVEFLAVNILIPSALEFGCDGQASRLKVVRRGDRNHDCLSVDCGIKCIALPWGATVRSAVLQCPEGSSAALSVDAVFIREMRARRFTICIRMMIGHDGKGRAATPHDPPSLEISPPYFKSATVELRDAPINRPASAGYVMI